MFLFLDNEAVEGEEGFLEDNSGVAHSGIHDRRLMLYDKVRSNVCTSHMLVLNMMLDLRNKGSWLFGKVESKIIPVALAGPATHGYYISFPTPVSLKPQK